MEVALIVVVCVTSEAARVTTEVLALPEIVLITVEVEAGRVVVIVMYEFALLTAVTVCAGRVVTLVDETIL